LTNSLKFGVGIWGVNFAKVKELCLHCEKLGYDFFFYGEGLGPECFTTLSALATVTERIRLGPGITFLTYRHPVLLAKIAATLDNVSNGRLEIRLGAGGAPGYGITKPAARVRVQQLREGLEIINGLLVNGTSSFTGKFFTIKEAICDVRPVQKPRPPITIAARQKNMLDLVARYADVWEGFFPPAEYNDKLKLLEELCSAASRDVSEVTKAVMLRVFIDKNQDKAIQAVNRYISVRGAEKARMEMLKSRDAVGDPQSCLSKLHEYMKLGVTRFTLLFPQVDNMQQLELFADEVMNKIR